MARKKRTSLEPEAEPTLDTSTQTGTATAEATVSGTSGEFSTEDTPPPAEAAAKFHAARELRQKCVELLSAKRENGDPLSDIAIASRLKVSPAYVAGVRAAHRADAPGQTIIPIPEQPQTAAEVAHEEARENFDLPPTAAEEETLVRVEQTFATSDPTRLRACPECGAGDQRIGSYCKACSRYVPLPDVVEEEAEPDPGTPAVVTAPEMMEPATPARKPRVRKVATPEPTPAAALPVVDDVAEPLIPHLTTSPADVPALPGTEFARPYLARKEMEGRAFLLFQLSGLESSMRRFPELLALADHLRDLRLFTEARFDAAPLNTLERLDAKATTRGLMLKLWGLSEDMQAHPPLHQLGVFVRNMLQAEEELQTEAEGK